MLTASAALPAPSGWQAELELGFSASSRADKTVLSSRRQRGPLAIQRPFYPEGDVCHAYLLHPPGGVVGGDQLAIKVQVDAAASTLLTTPGATKFYRSAGQQAAQHQQFTVAGTLEWLPQENIFFPGAQSTLSSHIELGADARYIGWEIHCLGRPVINERFEHGSLRFSTHLYRDQQPLFIDRLRIQSQQDLAGKAGLRNQPVMATLLATPASPAVLEMAREECAAVGLPHYAGATLMNGVLIVRYLGNSTAAAQALLRSLWQQIRPLVTERAAITPRIWNT